MALALGSGDSLTRSERAGESQATSPISGVTRGLEMSPPPSNTRGELEAASAAALAVQDRVG